RGDRRGALRLAQYIFIISLLAWALQASHVAHGLGEWIIFTVGLAQAALASAMSWLHYVALEPIARRACAQPLISSARLFNGRLRGRRGGRDLSIGTVLGVLVSILLKSSRIVPSWFGLESALDPMPLVYPLGTPSLIGKILEFQIKLISQCLYTLMLLVFLRIATRSVWAAAVGLVAINTAFYCTLDPEAT